MKTKIKRISVFVFVFVVFTFIVLILYNLRSQRLKETRISVFPVFSAYTINGTIFTTNDIDEGPVIIVFFDCDCEYCYSEINNIQKSGIEFFGIRKLFITNKFIQYDEVRELFPEHNDYLNIILDDTGELTKLFDIGSIPTTIIYDKDLELKKRFIGSIKIETILQYCNDN